MAPGRKGTPYKIGDVHNDWMVIGHHVKHENGSVIVMARCICGFKTPQILSYLRSGRTKRCRDCNNLSRTQVKQFCLCGCGEEITVKKHSSQKYVDIKHRRAHYRKVKVWTNKRKQEKISEFPKRLYVRLEGVCTTGGKCKSYPDCLNLDFKGHCHGKVDPSEHDQLYSNVNHFKLESRR